MADKVLPYIKDDDGSLLPVAAAYDENGDNIADTYAKKTDVYNVRLSRDSEGYLVIIEE